MASFGDELGKNEGTGVVKGKKMPSKDALAAIEARLDRMEEVMADRLNKLKEALVGPSKSKSRIGDFYSYITSLVFRVEELEEKVETFEERMQVAGNNHMENWEKTIASMELESELCKKAIVASRDVGVSMQKKKVSAPEPECYNGARDAHEIVNFI